MDLTIKVAIAGIIVAVLAPLLALELQKWLDERHESRSRKLTIFKNLMMYRATPLSQHFVQSLNLVDLEFNGKNKNDGEVRAQWKILLDHFNNYAEAKEPVEKAQELIRGLLKAMAKCFDYEFDEVYLKRGAYYPKYFADVEMEQNALRKQILELLGGDRRLPVGIFEQKFPEPVDVHTQELPVPQPKKLIG
jgi:hypothetical protein